MGLGLKLLRSIDQEMTRKEDPGFNLAAITAVG